MYGLAAKPNTHLRVFDLLHEGMSELLWPTRCVSCEAPGYLLCPDCQAKLGRIAQHERCLNCGAPFGWLVCCGCDEEWPELDGVICAVNYRGPGARIVKSLKDEHELSLAPYMAASLATAFDEASMWAEVVTRIPCEAEAPKYSFFSAGACGKDAFDACTFVPATAKAHVRRGFDHMALVSHGFSQLLDMPEEHCLRRVSREDQRALGKAGRMDNLQGSVQVVRDVCGMRLLLLDDVVTTGASMRECARALKARGARKVSGLAFARVW